MSDPRILSDEQLAAIRERCEKATPGPWRKCHASDGACQCGLIWSIPLDMTVVSVDHKDEYHEVPWDEFQANKDFIGNSRVDIPALLASHAALTEQLDIARRNSEQVQRLVHDLMEEQLQE